MSIFRINSMFDSTPALPPSNTGLPGFAQERLDNITSRAIQRHKNSLMVDNNPVYLWVRRPNGGLICTCQQKADQLGRSNQPSAFNNNVRASTPHIETVAVAE